MRTWRTTLLLLSCSAAAGCLGLIGDGPDGTQADGQGADDDGVAACSEVVGSPLRMRRLTNDAYRNTVRDLLGIDASQADGFLPDERSGGFGHNDLSPVSSGELDDYMRAAEDLALSAMQNVTELVDCDVATLGEATCATNFIRSFGPRAMRREITAEDEQWLLDLHASGDDFNDGVRLVVQALLQSPYFIYHFQIGTGEVREDGSLELSSHELASELSYMLWRTMPDPELVAAAEADTLRDADALRAQAERMLADPRASAALESFGLQWLWLEGSEQLDELTKSPDDYPQWDQATYQSSLRETTLFIDHVIRKGDASFETLMTADWSFVDDNLASIYGVDLDTDAIAVPGSELPNGWGAVSLPKAERRGLLTQVGLLATLAKTTNTDIPKRGLFTAEQIFCVPIATPESQNIKIPDPPDPDPNASLREQFAELTSGPKCIACHAVINPMGFSYESYSAIGRYRSEDRFGNSIDDSGGLPGTDVEAALGGATDVAMAASTSEQARSCFVRQWYRYAFGRDDSGDRCSVKTMAEPFVASGDVRELLMQMVTSDSFRYRRPGSN